MNKDNNANKHSHLTIIFIFILYKELLNDDLWFNKRFFGIEDFNYINKALYIIKFSLYNYLLLIGYDANDNISIQTSFFQYKIKVVSFSSPL